jgi:hypothetical protein
MPWLSTLSDQRTLSSPPDAVLNVILPLFSLALTKSLTKSLSILTLSCSPLTVHTIRLDTPLDGAGDHPESTFWFFFLFLILMHSFGIGPNIKFPFHPRPSLRQAVSTSSSIEPPPAPSSWASWGGPAKTFACVAGGCWGFAQAAKAAAEIFHPLHEKWITVDKIQEDLSEIRKESKGDSEKLTALRIDFSVLAANQTVMGEKLSAMATAQEHTASDVKQIMAALNIKAQ